MLECFGRTATWSSGCLKRTLRRFVFPSRPFFPALQTLISIAQVLCCTATLAWGVNLPAYAVVIKGTQVYDSGKGAFVDLSILDVLQIFGRAGRPQYEDQGVGYICTTSDKVDHYGALALVLILFLFQS
jgi:hypothetical protein